MKTKVYLSIAIRVITLCLLGFLGSYLPELLNRVDANILGDRDQTWGARHYWLFWMMVALFLLSLINFVVQVVNIIQKNYDTSKW